MSDGGDGLADFRNHAVIHLRTDRQRQTPRGERIGDGQYPVEIVIPGERRLTVTGGIVVATRLDSLKGER